MVGFALAAAPAAKSIFNVASGGIKKLAGIFGDNGPSTGTQRRRRGLAAILQALAGVKDANANKELEDILVEIGNDPGNKFWATSDANKQILIQELRGLISGQGSRPFNRYAPYWTDSPTLAKVGAFLAKESHLDEANTNLDAWKAQILASVAVDTSYNAPGTLTRAAEAASNIILADAAASTAGFLQTAGGSQFGQQVAVQYAKNQAMDFWSANKQQIMVMVVGTIIVSGGWWLMKKVLH